MSTIMALLNSSEIASLWDAVLSKSVRRSVCSLSITRPGALFMHPLHLCPPRDQGRMHFSRFWISPWLHSPRCIWALVTSFYAMQMEAGPVLAVCWTSSRCYVISRCEAVWWLCWWRWRWLALCLCAGDMCVHLCVCALCAHSYVHIAGYAFTYASLLYTAASANRRTTSLEHISYTASR